ALVIGAVNFGTTKPIEGRRRSNGGPRRAGVENPAAGDRHRRRVSANDVAIAPREDGRTLEAEPNERARSRRNRGLGADDCHAPENFRRPLMKADARAVLDRVGIGQELEYRVGQSSLLEDACAYEILAAADFVHLDAAEVDGRALPRNRLITPR